MTGATFYPPADRTSQWYGNGGATVSPINLGLHTTETPGGWPGYEGGGKAPNLTYEPWQHKWRQHFPLNGTARAFKNGADGYQTNRKGTCQVEISCYCDPAKFHIGKGIDKLDDQAYDDLGAWARFMHDEWGIPLEVKVQTKPFDASYGKKNGVRLTRAQFEAYRGLLEHQNVPDNKHGDGGALDIARIVALAGGSIVAARRGRRPEEDDMIIVQLVDGDQGVYALQRDAAPRHLNPEEFTALKQCGFEVTQCNTRQRDVINAVLQQP